MYQGLQGQPKLLLPAGISHSCHHLGSQWVTLFSKLTTLFDLILISILNGTFVVSALRRAYVWFSI